MNIWLINPYDELPGEGPEQRYGCLACTLAERGHEVVWASSAFRHRSKSEVRGREHGAGGMEHGAGGGEGLRVVLVDAPGYEKNVSVRRLWSQWKWGRRVERDMKRKVASGELSKPDVILASSPPLEGARAGLRLAKFFGAKGIVDFMDDWPETWLGVGWENSNIEHPTLNIELRKWVLGTLGKVALWPWFRMARRIYLNADAVSAQSHAFARRARELGHPGEVHVCYLGGARSALECGSGERNERSFRFGGEEAEKGVSQEKGVSPCHCAFSPSDPDRGENGTMHGLTPFSILYLGAMGRIYDIDTLLQAAVRAKEEGLNCRWTLAGEDPEGHWEKTAKAYGVGDRVSFPGYLDPGDLDQVLRMSDVGLIPMDPASGVAVPYKAGDYLGAGLPVVNSLPGELSDLLRTYGAGADYRYGDPASLLARVRSMAEDPEALTAASEAAGRLFDACFNRQITYPQFAEWITGRKEE